LAGLGGDASEFNLDSVDVVTVVDSLAVGSSPGALENLGAEDLSNSSPSVVDGEVPSSSSLQVSDEPETVGSPGSNLGSGGKPSGGDFLGKSEETESGESSSHLVTVKDSLLGFSDDEFSPGSTLSDLEESVSSSDD